MVMDYDLLLDDYVGQFGLWQKLVFGLAGVAACGSAFMTLMSTFSQFTPSQYRCRIPECDSDSSDFNLNVSFAIPQDSMCTHYQWINITENKCHPDNFDHSVERVCDQHIYDVTESTSNYGVSIVSQFDLVCNSDDDTWPFGSLITKAALVGMAYMFGMLLGSFVCGIMSDKIGRKKTLLIAITVTFLSSLGGAFVREYWAYLALRFLSGIFSKGLFMLAFMISVEISGADYKTGLGILIQIPFAFGEVLVGLVAYFIRDWSRLQIVLSSSLSIVGLISLLLPESPRWLVSQHKYKEAKMVLIRGAGLNGRALPEDLLCYEHDRKLHRTSDPHELEDLGCTSMFSSWYITRNSLVMFLNWLVATMCYYGLSMSSVNLSGNIYVNFILSIVVEVPSYLFTFFLIDGIGRKTLLVLCQCLAGVSCIVAGFLYSEKMSVPVVVLSLAGKFGASSSFAIVYLYTAELYPTSIRNTAVGTASMIARIGGIAAPILASIKGVLPLIIMGGSSLAGGLLALLLPETLGTKLPETLEDIKDLSKHSKPFWKWMKKAELQEIKKIRSKKFENSNTENGQVADTQPKSIVVPTIIIEDMSNTNTYI